MYRSFVSRVLSCERWKAASQNDWGTSFKLIEPSVPLIGPLPLPELAVMNWPSVGSAPGANSSFQVYGSERGASTWPVTGTV